MASWWGWLFLALGISVWATSALAEDELLLRDLWKNHPGIEQVHVRTTIEFPADKDYLNFLKPAPVSYLSELLSMLWGPRNPHDNPTVGDTYCAIEKRPGSGPIISAQDVKITSIKENYGSHTGAYKGTVIGLSAPLSSITCVRNLSYNDLTYPDVEMPDGSNFHQKVWDGDRPTVEDFQITFAGTLDIDL